MLETALDGRKAIARGGLFVCHITETERHCDAFDEKKSDHYLNLRYYVINSDSVRLQCK
jgi:hypothetical protein